MKRVTYETTCNAGTYIHTFQDGQIVRIPLLNEDRYTTRIHLKIITNENCKLRLYTLHRGKLVWCDYEGNYLRLNCYSRKLNLLELDAKYVAFATNKDCILYIEFLYDSVSHINPMLKSPRFDTTHALDYIPQEVLYGNTEIKGIKYYLMANRAITMTQQANTSLKYPPYSIKIDARRECKLIYKMTLKCSEGDEAVVTVSCIEATSGANYCLVENLSNVHTGQHVEGSFRVPAGYMDIGLLISTPYGFSGDFGIDPKIDCIKFDRFAVEY